MSYPTYSDRNHHPCLRPPAKLSSPLPDLVRQEVEAEVEEVEEAEVEEVEEVVVVQQEAHKQEGIDPPEDLLDPNHRRSLEIDWMLNDS